MKKNHDKGLEYPFWNFRNNSLPYALPGKTRRTTKVDNHTLPHYHVQLPSPWNGTMRQISSDARAFSFELTYTKLTLMSHSKKRKYLLQQWQTALVLFLTTIGCGTATVSADHTQLGKCVQSLPLKSWFFRQYIQTQTWLPNATFRPTSRWHEETQ